jgi:demethylmenaquinone methyltransferase/2-methoxy-6-polyprenyl-1,4-benzoquinol methylase
LYRQEEIKPYQQNGEKARQVEAMFDNIAPTYDALNHRLSWNIDRYWRNKAIRRLQTHKPQVILDMATGTGDFALLAAEKLKPQQIIGADISEGMMDIGRKKTTEKGYDNIISFERQDCTALSYTDDSFDAVIAAFGIRNFQDLEKGLSEMLRVLKPGGVLCVLELTQPIHFPVKQLFRIYSHTILPIYGRLISKDNAAYSYLTKTIEAFPQGERMVDILKKIGFSTATFERLTFGICTLYIAKK